MGASAHSFIKGKNGGINNDLGKSLADEANKLEENQFVIVAGLLLSVIMMSLITRKIKKELMKVRYEGEHHIVALDLNYESDCFLRALISLNINHAFYDHFPFKL